MQGTSTFGDNAGNQRAQNIRQLEILCSFYVRGRVCAKGQDICLRQRPEACFWNGILLRGNNLEELELQQCWRQALLEEAEHQPR